MQTHTAASLHPSQSSPTHTPFCEIRTGAEGAAQVIHVGGELDRADCPRLDRALHDAEHSDSTLVVVNCAELHFIDAAGLNSLHAATLRSRADGDRLRITGGTRGVAKLFKVSGLDAVLPLTGVADGA